MQVVFQTSIPAAYARTKGENTVLPAQQNYELGRKRFDEGDIDGAIDAFLQAIYFERAGYHPNAYYGLGRCYALKKEDGKAIDALKHSVVQNLQNTTDAYCLLAEIYLRNDRLAEGETAAKKAVVAGRGQNPVGHYVMGLVDIKRGDLVDAQTHFLDALGKPPWHYTEAWMNLANTMFLSHNWRGAIHHYRGMIAAKDRLKGINLEEIYYKLGYCTLQIGDHQGALDCWHTCLNYNSQNADAHLQLAKMFDSERHVSSAIKEYREFIRTAGEHHPPELLAKAKDRLAFLEQQISPVEAEPQAAKPSPCMRKEVEERMRAQQQEEEEAKKRAGFTGPFDPNHPLESGF